MHFQNLWSMTYICESCILSTLILFFNHNFYFLTKFYKEKRFFIVPSKGEGLEPMTPTSPFKYSLGDLIEFHDSSVHLIFIIFSFQKHIRKERSTLQSRNTVQRHDLSSFRTRLCYWRGCHLYWPESSPN